MIAIDSDVSHKPWSIVLLIVQIYLLTMEYQVVQFVPNLPFRTIREHVFNNPPIDFVSSS